MKRISAILIAMLIVLSCFTLASCGDGQKEQTDNVQEEKKEKSDDAEHNFDLSDEPLEIAEDAKELYSGKTFVIDSPTPWGADMFVREGINGDPLNDSIYNMNASVYDKIGVTLHSTMSTSTDKQYKAFQDDVLGGKHSFDVMAVHTEQDCAPLVIADVVLNFDYLDAIDLEKPWWNATFSESTSILGYNYFGVSSSCYAIYSNTIAILFNKTLAEEAGLPDLYELVRKGEWTIDKMISLTKNFSQDLNSDGIYDENDLLALVSDSGPHINAWLGAFRQSTVEKGENDVPNIVVSSARMDLIISKLNMLYNTGRRAVTYDILERQFGDDLLNKAFAEGRVLFDVANIEQVSGLRDYDINYGILPMPKLNEEQEEYGSYVEAWHLCFAVPKDCEDYDYCGTVLETMAYYSYHYTYPAILDNVIYGTGTRDEESYEMLDIIYKNMIWDFGYVYNGNNSGFAVMPCVLVSQNSSDLASYIARRESNVEKHFDDLYQAAQLNAR